MEFVELRGICGRRRTLSCITQRGLVVNICVSWISIDRFNFDLDFDLGLFEFHRVLRSLHLARACLDALRHTYMTNKERQYKEQGGLQIQQYPRMVLEYRKISSAKVLSGLKE